ncbi:hypothetical protein FOMPIDRAFT_1061456 [Fomitopsis schrenkii]|uniref:Arrestin-like N-terminal domain-containing protein n=1 Tax=Fomitopsis schrenkii TaxID=2126942 RepID=S8E0J8_FOMSC|nr:hypothetical protein FOMPIDRAFT_1061456 [Fomitopsis schrenkii]
MSTWYLSAIRVAAPQKPVVAGDIVEGSVRLDIRALGAERVGEVRVNLSGILHSSISRHGRSLADTASLVKDSISVWRRGMPSSSSDILSVPFKFRLPADLPPSFDFTDAGHSTRISYTIEAVPDHSGVRMARVEVPLTVIPDDPKGGRVRPALDAGWEGPWTTKAVREQLNRAHGVVGDATVELTYPSIHSLPVSAIIPFTLHVITVSPPVSRDDGGTIWPAPPSHPREVLAEVEQRVSIRIGAETRTHVAPMVSMWGGATDVRPFEKEWLSTEGGTVTGRWRQKMTLRSSFTLPGPPSFSFTRDGSSEVRVEYALRVTTHFGAHYSLTHNVPVVVSSGRSKSMASENSVAIPSIVTTEEHSPPQHRGIESRLSRLEPPMDWFNPVPTDEDTSFPLRRVITAPDSRPPCSRSDNGERPGRRLQQHDLPMDWFATGEGTPPPGRANGTRAVSHGYNRSLNLLDNSIALFESSLRPSGSRLRPVRSASPPRGTRRVRNYAVADPPENMYGSDYSMFAPPRPTAQRNRAHAPAFETRRAEETEYSELPSYRESVGDEPPPYEE